MIYKWDYKTKDLQYDKHCGCNICWEQHKFISLDLCSWKFDYKEMQWDFVPYKVLFLGFFRLSFGELGYWIEFDKCHENIKRKNKYLYLPNDGLIHTDEYLDFWQVWCGFFNNDPFPLPDQPSVAVWCFWKACSEKYKLKLNIAYTMIFVLFLLNIILLLK